MEITKPLKIEYDQYKDQVRIAGVLFSGHFFRFFNEEVPPTDFEFLKNDDGVITIRQKPIL